MIQLYSPPVYLHILSTSDEYFAINRKRGIFFPWTKHLGVTPSTPQARQPIVTFDSLVALVTLAGNIALDLQSVKEE